MTATAQKSEKPLVLCPTFRNFALVFETTINKEVKMDHLPKDPAILVSSVNMLLRDEEFDTLEALCYNFGTEPKEIKGYLLHHGFVYSEEQRQFRPIGYDKQ